MFVSPSCGIILLCFFSVTHIFGWTHANDREMVQRGIQAPDFRHWKARSAMYLFKWQRKGPLVLCFAKVFFNQTSRLV